MSQENEENERLTPEDLADDDDISIQNQPSSQANNTQPQSTEDSSVFINLKNKLTNLLNTFSNNSNTTENTLSTLTSSFKSEFKDILLKHPLSNENETEIAQLLLNFHNKTIQDNSTTNQSAYIQFIFDLYEILPYFYKPEDFQIEINYETFNIFSLNEIDLLELFKNILPKNNNNNSINNVIDILIIYLFSNYSDYKALYVENNLLLGYPSRSVFITFKFICLNVFLYNKIIQNKLNKHLYVESLSNVAKLLLQEASYYNQKFNNEFYNNAFSDFDFNADDKVKRKLSMDEFKFLSLHLFKFLYIITANYYRGIEINFNITSNKSRRIFWEYYDKDLKGENYDINETNLHLNVFHYYTLICFICDILSFIYTNFLYFSREFLHGNVINIESIDPFHMFKNDWKDPKFHYEYIMFLKQDIIDRHIGDIVIFIEMFICLTDLKDQFKDKYEQCYNKNSTFSFFIIQPVNSIGLSIITWIINKNKNLSKDITYDFNKMYSPLYLFDIQLPLIASLLKSGHNLKYVAIEWLIMLSDSYKEAIVPSMKSLIYYSFDDIFNDILEFIGSGDSDSLRKYVYNKIKSILNLLSIGAKIEFFNYYIDTALTPSEDKQLNDDKISFFIQIIKSFLDENITNNEVFNEQFVKKIIEVFAVKSYEKIFIFEIIETIAQAMNFLHYAILKDKRKFKGALNIYNKEYLYQMRKNLNEIINLVDKFIKSPDEEKYKTLRLDPNGTLGDREDVKEAFNKKKNQCMVLLDLCNNVDNLITKCLNELNEKQN